VPDDDPEPPDSPGGDATSGDSCDGIAPEGAPGCGAFDNPTRIALQLKKKAKIPRSIRMTMIRMIMGFFMFITA
jgi:hypothetical protein